MSERLFVAIWPSPKVVAQLIAELPWDSQSLRWQPPDRWHITLAFLGDRGVQKEQRRFHELNVGQAGPLQLAGAGSFGPVVWLGVNAGPWLDELARRCQRHFDAADRRFRAHLTVARARSKSARPDVLRAVAELDSLQSTAWYPEDVTLVRSTLGPKAAYEVIGRRPFGVP